MKKHFFPLVVLFISFFFLLGSSFTTADKTPPAGDYYQLTVYHIKNAEQLSVTSTYLKNIYLPALHKTGLTNIGVFSSIDNDTATDKKLYVLIPFASLQKFETLMDKLTAGTLLKNDTSSYSNAAYNKPP
jgi:hypothetical protein